MVRVYIKCIEDKFSPLGVLSDREPDGSLVFSSKYCSRIKYVNCKTDEDVVELNHCAFSFFDSLTNISRERVDEILTACAA